MPTKGVFITAVIVTIFGIAHIMSGGLLFANMISKGILGLAICAIGVVWRALHYLYTEEVPRLMDLERKLRETPESAANLIIDVPPAGSGDSKTLVIDNVLRTALTQGQTEDARGDFAVLIHWSRYLAGIFVFLGLLGTVWGIASAVTSLGASVTSISQATANDTGLGGTTFEGWNRLQQGIESLLIGMKSAFSSTLVGLLATLAVSWLNSYYLSYCEEMQTRIRKLAQWYFIPLYQQSINGQSTGLQTDQLKNVVNDLSDVTGRLSKDVVGKLSDVTGRLSKDVVAKLSEVTGRLSENTGLLTTNLDKATQRLGTVLSQTDELCRMLQDTTKQIATENSATRGWVAQEQDRQAVELKRIEQERKNLIATAGVWQEQFTKIESHMNKLAVAATVLPEQRDLILTTATSVTQSATQMAEAARSLKEQIAVGQDNQLNLQRGFIAGLEKTQQELNAMLRQFQITLNDVAAVADSHLNRVEMNQLRDSLASETVELRGSLASDLDQLRRSMASDIEKLQKLLNIVVKQTTPQATEPERSQPQRNQPRAHSAPTPLTSPRPAPASSRPDQAVVSNSPLGQPEQTRLGPREPAIAKPDTTTKRPSQANDGLRTGIQEPMRAGQPQPGVVEERSSSTAVPEQSREAVNERNTMDQLETVPWFKRALRALRLRK